MGAGGVPLAPMIGLDIMILEKRFPAVGEAPSRLVYQDFRLRVAAGEFLTLLGQSGVGKTTLLQIIAGLDPDYQGDVRFSGNATPRIAYVFQTPRLLPWRTVLDNVRLPIGKGRVAERKARALLAEMGMADAAAVFPQRLSLGMQRRAALARAFVIDPDLLLMDEPFVSLDEMTARHLRDLLRGVLEQRAATVVFVTHDSREAVELGSRLVRLDGVPARVVEDRGIALSAGERRNPEAVERTRRQILGEAVPRRVKPSGE
jgi:NitT/TauT family transport system ATP-binding protein